MEDSVIVEGTEEARELIRRIRDREPNSKLSLIVGGGCCDNTAPQLYSNFSVGPTMREVGKVEQVPVFVETQLLKTYDGAKLVFGAHRTEVPSDSFSLETASGYRLTLSISKGTKSGVRKSPSS